ncbi:muramoyltetrapeptide carboxypeptidase LdcA involved in peptidoglycan recycling [Asanoa ferruginea]|uniref:Muramoyltetrapeptide carboxypeptidase LdcA involved in peptidoglycan recycling n=1 Tax=Asanoa ferruginea TaxID=53367 RepID=A0A3D9ZCY2_9ACTN|nr:S66 peptidase family protein [Asanoa ferruginea]REF95181.1 muramoyltetrapeptide carboxypeptidase LdcA involved in peptidoglycan recycling [Asanoa ferruginea]GIF53403.1 muramoyltetrapeptide carboxypeptidase [Asanoa ferruginea]
MRYPTKPRPGSRVAVISPSAGLPAIHPAPYELGLRRLREEFKLEPVEYPTTRIMNAPPADRARDVMAAFADPTIDAVLSSIGGDDQLRILRHLDPAVLSANPKPFFGYSDNTTLLNYLYGLGIVGYHGGSVMVQLGRAGDLHPLTRESLNAALFGSDWFELTPSADYTDEPVDWLTPDYPSASERMFPSSGWTWHGAVAAVTGPLWGGNIEVLTWLLAADKVAAPPPGAIFFAETSEDMPPATEVYYMLRNLGERGWLADVPAILMGRPKCWERTNPLSPAAKQAYADDQRAAVLRAAAEYAPDAVLVLDLDIGHTDPQQVLPYGGEARVDAQARRISVRY